MGSFVRRARREEGAAHRRGHGFLPAGERVRGCRLLRAAGAQGGGGGERARPARRRRRRRHVQDGVHHGRSVLRGQVRAQGDAPVLHRRRDRVALAAGVLPRSRAGWRFGGGDHAVRALFLHGELLSRHGSGDLGGGQRDLSPQGSLQGCRVLHGCEQDHQRDGCDDVFVPVALARRRGRVFSLCVRVSLSLRVHFCAAAGDQG